MAPLVETVLERMLAMPEAQVTPGGDDLTLDRVVATDHLARDCADAAATEIRKRG